MSSKQSRAGEIVAVRRTTEPIYQGHALTGQYVWTTATVRIIDEGPEHGRLVQVHMDPEEALTWAQRLIDAAGQTQDTRADVGHTEA
ncbi:hypothetical protein ACH4S8_37975 [Streptomyces sp. NPDC021080]|uniref:hypothetical protein n=1 Tax=Streptomyces sp. NPDC021080 TaxID=3365110 RepID=UPI00379D5A93